jgi:hypothetical protein
MLIVIIEALNQLNLSVLEDATFTDSSESSEIVVNLSGNTVAGN